MRRYSPTTDVQPVEQSPLFSLIGRLGLGLLLLILVLAPAIGGFPPGMAYGADMSLAALRCLTLFAGVAVGATSLRTGGICGSLAGKFLWGAVGATLVSLLVHSGFLTSPVLLFALVPSALDWLCYGVIFALTAHFAREEKVRDWLLIALLAGGVWAALNGAIEVLTSTLPGARAQSPFFSPNFLGGFLGLCLPISAAWFAATTERRLQMGLGVTTALLGGTLVATGSRAGIALTLGGLVVALLLSLIARRGKLPWIPIAILTLGLIGVGFLFSGGLRTRAASGAGSQEHSGAYRTWTWKGTVAMAQANPILGTGPGTYPYLYPKYALVAKTELAHSSYLQIAAEQGFPALLLVGLSLVSTLGRGLLPFFHREPRATEGGQELTSEARLLLLAGLIGGVLVGTLRSIFDSEWSLLGNGVPFWAVAGLTVGVAASTAKAPTAMGDSGEKPASRHAVINAGVLTVICLLGALLSVRVLYGVQARDAVQLQVQSGKRPAEMPSVWPPDPQLLAWGGKPDEAAKVEPSAKRFYQLGRVYEEAGQKDEAIRALELSLKADPNSLQTWQKLAELRTEVGDVRGALTAWQELINREEGPTGQIRAIPELRETRAAWAYFALAQDAKERDRNAAKALYEKAAVVVEEYSRTSELYQKMEVISALTTGTDVAKKRQELRVLYDNIIREWSGLEPAKATDLTTRQAETLRRLDTFVAPETPGSVAAPS